MEIHSNLTSIGKKSIHHLLFPYPRTTDISILRIYPPPHPHSSFRARFIQTTHTQTFHILKKKMVGSSVVPFSLLHPSKWGEVPGAQIHPPTPVHRTLYCPPVRNCLNGHSDFQGPTLRVASQEPLNTKPGDTSWGDGQEYKGLSWMSQVQILSSVIPSCVTLGMSPNLSEPQPPPL